MFPLCKNPHLTLWTTEGTCWYHYWTVTEIMPLLDLTNIWVIACCYAGRKVERGGEKLHLRIDGEIGKKKHS